jgi:hypothetical protein
MHGRGAFLSVLLTFPAGVVVSTLSDSYATLMHQVGVASSMAAAGFTACMGGSPKQILQAAEIALEHSLGLTCDPIGGTSNTRPPHLLDPLSLFVPVSGRVCAVT